MVESQSYLRQTRSLSGGFKGGFCTACFLPFNVMMENKLSSLFRELSGFQTDFCPYPSWGYFKTAKNLIKTYVKTVCQIDIYTLSCAEVHVFSQSLR